MAVVLRDYQASFVADIADAFTRHRRVCGVASTGAGKTVVFCHITAGAMRKGNQTLILAHRAQICRQISASLHEQGVRHGRLQPSFTMTDDLVQVGMVQTVANRLDRIKPPKFIVVDEGHHALAPMYLRIFAAFPDARVLLMTATPARPDGKGLKAVADVLVEAIPMRELIQRGALAPYRYMAPPQLADLSRIKVRAGDYAVDELAAEMDKAVITGSAIEHYKQHMPGLPAVVFCVNVAHAEHVAAQFQAAGVRAAAVDGRLSQDVVDRRLAQLGDGGLHVVTSCDLISEGVDVPNLAGAFLLRPTHSIVTYRQQVGRALRKKKDGSAAWLFDHVGNYIRHGLPDAHIEWSLEGQKKKKENAITTATCKACFKVFQTYPGWRAEQDACLDVVSDCVLLPPDKDGGFRKPPEERDGVLVEVSDLPAVSREQRIRDAKGDDFKWFVRSARTQAQLEEIARIRGLKHGWVKHIMEARHGH